MFIYIPIWLDLLFVIGKLDKDIIRDLHSNMVRFIIFAKIILFALVMTFTFQYG